MVDDGCFYRASSRFRYRYVGNQALGRNGRLVRGDDANHADVVHSSGVACEPSAEVASAPAAVNNSAAGSANNNANAVTSIAPANAPRRQGSLAARRPPSSNSSSSSSTTAGFRRARQHHHHHHLATRVGRAGGDPSSASTASSCLSDGSHLQPPPTLLTSSSSSKKKQKGKNGAFEGECTTLVLAFKVASNKFPVAQETRARLRGATPKVARAIRRRRTSVAAIAIRLAARPQTAAWKTTPIRRSCRVPNPNRRTRGWPPPGARRPLRPDVVVDDSVAADPTPSASAWKTRSRGPTIRTSAF